MKHRHIATSDWTLMAIGSLFDRGDLADWREFARAVRCDPDLAARTLLVCRSREPDGSEGIALALIAHHHPTLAPFDGGFAL